MTSCNSSSASARVRLAVALAVTALAACRHAPPVARPQLRIAVFPAQNAAGDTAPVRALTEALDLALSQRRVDVVPRRELDRVLALHRVRWTGGVDGGVAKLLRDELSVDAVLVPTVEEYLDASTPKIALSVRLSSTRERPTVLWADSVARKGNDSPGLLGVGLVRRAAALDAEVVTRVADSVERWVATGAAGESCGAAGRFGPRRAFRAPVLDDVGRRTVAVLPFTSASARRSAGDVLFGQLVAQLVRSGSFEVIDPGVVRDQLLSHRIVLEDGVSVDQAIALLELLDADLVASGAVRVYEPKGAGTEPPTVEFSAFMLDGRTGEVVWSSSSYADGEDGVFFFGAGRIYTASALSCRMVRGVVDRIVGDRMGLASANIEPPQGLRARDGALQFQRRARQPSLRRSNEIAGTAQARSVNERVIPPGSRVTPQEPKK